MILQLGTRLAVVVDTRERYPAITANQQVSIERAALDAATTRC